MREFCDSLTKEAKFWRRGAKEVEQVSKGVGFGKIMTFPLRLTGHIVKNIGQSLAERPITTLLAGGGIYGGYKHLQRKKQQGLGRARQTVDYVIPGGY